MELDAVAIVGMACRLPQAPDLHAFWRLLRDGRSAVTPTPSARWDGSLPEGDEAAGFGAFLSDVRGFDADFFGVSPREAAAMDPQQRLVLELAWEALENAGIVPASLAGDRVGVFVGALRDDYAVLSLADEDAITGHTVTGTHRGILANRVSYALGLRGPSLTVDTAQSSSLVALHLAATSVRTGESCLAIAGGVNLNLLRAGAVAASRFGGLSEDGRCFTFDARANGYARGEGGGVVVLKPLVRAVAEHDPIHCVLLGGAVNNDGATDGLTVPSALAQEEVLREACRQAGVDPARLEYVELHGSGTKVGDPIEAQALGATRDRGQPLLVGSVKTNVGHLEGAGGVIGLIKTALSLTHREIPASLNHEQPNPAIPLTELGLRVTTEPMPWPATDRPLAGVSSFGMGGTNCHLVLTAAPQAPAERPPPIEAVPLPLSGRTEQALRDQAGRLSDFLRSEASPDLAAVAHTAATARTHFRHRAVVTGREREDLLRGLDALAAGEPDRDLAHGVAGRTGRTVFVFPGQGSQWVGMGAVLLESSPVFREHIHACASALAPYTDWSLLDVLRGATPLDRVDVVQPALFAVMVSLAQVWRSLGVHPDAVIGHSQGEIAAACVAGALTLEEAAKVVALRSRALTALAGTGSMAVVALPAEQVEQRLAAHPRLAVAALNSPFSTVVSGPGEELEAFVGACEREELRVRRIAVDYASHCVQVEAVRDQLLADLRGLAPRSTTVVFHSTVTGEPLDTSALTADYWFANLRRPVRFAPAVTALLADGHDVFVEVSPHPVLTGAVLDIADAAGTEPVVTETLRRDEGDWQRVLTSAAALHVAGAEVDWARVLPAPPARRPQLPGYPFQRRPYWLDSLPGATAPVTTAERTPSPLGHPRPEAADPALTFTSPAQELAALHGDRRHRRLLDLVRTHAAVVRGEPDPATVPAERAFRDIGFDSLMAVELRNRLVQVTGLALPRTVVFDNPSPQALADLLHTELGGTGEDVLTALDRVEAGCADDQDDQARSAVIARLEGLLARLHRQRPDAGGPAHVGAATDEELFRMLDDELMDHPSPLPEESDAE